jgi:hypothetical protein
LHQPPPCAALINLPNPGIATPPFPAIFIVQTLSSTRIYSSDNPALPQ